MTERPGTVTLHGNPLTLVGREVRVGDQAPDFEVVDNGLNSIKFSSLPKKVYVLASVPSLDTPTCDLETRRSNQEAAQLNRDTVLLTISMDLPFAQKRWCGAEGVDRVKTLSDHREASFGLAYGVLIKELRLLARAVFIVDCAGIIQYTQLVKELADEPNYEEVLQAVREIVR